MKIGRDRALTIARVLQQGANRAKVAASKRSLSRCEKKMKRILEILDKAAEEAFKPYYKILYSIYPGSYNQAVGL